MIPTQRQILAALEASRREWDAYSLERDWAELIDARRVPAWVKTEGQYLAMLFARDRGLSPDDAANAANELTRVFGASATAEAVRQVRDAWTTPPPVMLNRRFDDPTLNYWQMESLRLATRYAEREKEAGALIESRKLVPADRTLADSREPLDAVVGLLAAASPEGFVRTLSMEQARRSKENQSSPGGVQMRSAPWAEADAEYQRIVAKYGKEALLAAGAAIKAAPTYQYGALANPRALGVNVDNRYDAMIALLELKSGRPTASGAIKKTTTAASPVQAAWSAIKKNDLVWVDFWALAGGVRRTDSVIERTRARGVADNGQVALHFESYSIVPGNDSRVPPALGRRSAERMTAALYPAEGKEVGDAPVFLALDRWPWTADEPGAVADSGLETLTIDGGPVDCQWWSLTVPGTPLLKVAWFSARVPGGLVRSFVRAKDGSLSEVMAVSIEGSLQQTDGNLLPLLAARLGAPVGTVAKTSGAPGAIFNGPQWTAPPRIPSGTRFSVTTTLELGDRVVAGPALLSQDFAIFI
jgi:hypothetical protein